MCGRYLIEEEAYSDILEILYRSGALSPVSNSTGEVLPHALKEALAAAMHSNIAETVPGGMRDLFPGAPAVVINGEVFPTNIAPVLTNSGEGAALIKWGFPHWKDSSVIINARAETALEKQMFRKALLEQRCVILSNGFYEWGAGGGRSSRKTKYLLRRSDESKLYMAGFCRFFRDAGGDEHTAFVILTTAACESVSPIHSRMPLILSPDEISDWLGSAEFMQYALHRPGPELEAAAA